MVIISKIVRKFKKAKNSIKHHSYISISLLVAAGKAFMEAAQLQINLQSKHEAGQRYVDAGNCFKKTDVEGKFSLF